MITALDHVAVTVPDVAAAAADYATVLGLSLGPSQGVTTAAAACRLQTANIGVELAATSKTTTSPVGLAFAVDDVAVAARRFGRRGLSGTIDPDGSAFRIDPAATHGVAISVVGGVPPAPVSIGDIAGLDHVVIRSPDPERAVALYGGRLGLDLRLDRTNEAIGHRLLFFVCGDLVVEISHDTRQGVRAGEDRIAGFAWRAADIEQAHQRMTRAGVTVSDLRTGRRAGTRVFTVKSHTCGVPTLVIGGEGLKRV